MRDYFLKSYFKFTFLKKKPKRSQKIKRSQTKIFSCQTGSKEAKIEKFGAFDAKLATLGSSEVNKYLNAEEFAEVVPDVPVNSINTYL